MTSHAPARALLFIADASSPLFAQAPAKWRLDPIATIEGISADDPFVSIRSIALHPDGRLVVVDQRTKQVTMFDAQGKSLGVVGRIGAGPGEYRDPYSAVWLADTLAIYDPRESRVVFLVNGKTPLRTQSTMPLSGGSAVRFYSVSRTKAYLFQSRRVGNQSQTAFVGFGGGRSDTVAQPPRPPLATGTFCKIENGGIRGFTWPQAPRFLSFPVRADGAVIVGHTGLYNFTVQGKSGVVATLARKDFTPKPLTDFMWEEQNAEYRKQIKDYGEASCDAKPVRPPHRAPIQAISVADNGDIWTSVIGQDELGFNVFSPTGQFRATVPGPVRGIWDVPASIAGDRIAYVEDDRDGVQVVKVARLVK